MSTAVPAPLRDLIGVDGGLLLPGVANALTARIAEDLGFRAVYITGAGVANTFLGLPDIGLLSLTEMAAHVGAISDAVDVPVIVDADTGFGNAISVVRTVRLLEKAGACGIQLEDQVAPKRCGHFEGQKVIPSAEMRQKIRAATESRRSENTLIIARTDARAEHGLSEALDRAAAYAEAGADVLFIEGLRSRDELAEAGAALPGVPKLANMVEGGKTPLLAREDLLAMGYSILLYANAAMQGAIHGAQKVLAGLRDAGSLGPVLDDLTPWHERQRLVRRDDFNDLDKRYQAE
ncbi:carboxyvinyl-carboxyphosphonate phosphorylmutase [Streptomyces spinoverrucosus]|uniref:Carboxyvinyl-carboxyphosphonate phosphorylmutase n=1 Tax=Streptomyces spinoverrucosus TaxID=284043 RepID=A0A4Y3W0G9_9ACTN|nr:oxaloacetate decarboxylase [Streptomyces spinoverrucosus]GEC10776.1 carboxyvinyl-carboxyphosphonate phosphorylmutase [Streptomyces spinoverrucosus]GHC00313.1 carboxyvinyl-carboxyphosphonate phosphorylmutase [Streptomyces spinoverrucosus]